MTRDELLQRIWGRRETHRDRTVDVFVRKLREKVDRKARDHTFIQTRYGVGYKLEPQSKWSSINPGPRIGYRVVPSRQSAAKIATPRSPVQSE